MRGCAGDFSARAPLPHGRPWRATLALHLLRAGGGRGAACFDVALAHRARPRFDVRGARELHAADWIAAVHILPEHWARGHFRAARLRAGGAAATDARVCRPRSMRTGTGGRAKSAKIPRTAHDREQMGDAAGRGSYRGRTWTPRKATWQSWRGCCECIIGEKRYHEVVSRRKQACLGWRGGGEVAGGWGGTMRACKCIHCPSTRRKAAQRGWGPCW